MLLISCDHQTRVNSDSYNRESTQTSGLDDYWYQGKAEITTYTLQQNRYNDLHPGEQVIIFVTEDFLTDLQVKNEMNTRTNSAPILKCNKMKRFTTGVYDYSMMTSVFTPVDKRKYPHTLKVSMSSQDWCGQSFHQVNFKNDAYFSTLHSYFQNEADKVVEVKKSVLEDEIFNLIRFGPEFLPKGEIEMVPTLEYLRFKHLEINALRAIADLENYSGEEWDNNDVMVYKIQYPSEKRVLEIYFEKEKPYKIIGWDDQYPSVFDGQLRTTKARKNKESYIAYWKMNEPDNEADRKKLGL